MSNVIKFTPECALDNILDRWVDEKTAYEGHYILIRCEYHDDSDEPSIEFTYSDHSCVPQLVFLLERVKFALLHEDSHD